MRKKSTDDEMAVNMTPMIDVVFQLIIFFITTVDLENKALDTNVRMAMSPHGMVVEQKDPRTVTVDVDDSGKISIVNVPLSKGQLIAVLKKSVQQYGNSIPVVIRGDIDTKHEYIRQVMDACTAAGLWKVKFAAIKEHA